MNQKIFAKSESIVSKESNKRHHQRPCKTEKVMDSTYVSQVFFFQRFLFSTIGRVEDIFLSPFFSVKNEKGSRSFFMFIFIYLLLVNPISLPAALSFDGPRAEEILPSVSR